MDLVGTRVEIRRYDREVKSHTHPHHQIVLPLRGALEMEIDGRAGAARGDTAALVAAGTDHSFAGAPDGAFLIVDIAGRGTHEHLYRAPIWQATAPAPFFHLDRSLSLLCQHLAGEVAQYGPNRLDMVASGEVLLTALGRRMGFDSGRADEGLAKALRFIEAHYAESITVAQVAAMAGLSTSRLHAMFRTRMQTSPKRYIAARRLYHASRLLVQSERSIAAISFRAGYGDQSAFTRAFKRAYAQSPASFRREARDRETRHKLQ